MQCPPASSTVDELFDLKGSLVNRDADENEIAGQPTWKDNDFLSKGRQCTSPATRANGSWRAAPRRQVPGEAS